MVTIVTDVRLKQGAESQWDRTMRTRLSNVDRQPGWVSGQLLAPADQPHTRVIVGTWRSRDDWQRWHEDPLFAETRRTLDGLAAGPAQHTWHEVVLDAARTPEL